MDRLAFRGRGRTQEGIHGGEIYRNGWMNEWTDERRDEG